MKRKVTVETDNYEVTEVHASWDEEEANRMLQDGWCLLHGCMGHKDNMGYQAKPCWLLGKKRTC